MRAGNFQEGGSDYGPPKAAWLVRSGPALGGVLSIWAARALGVCVLFATDFDLRSRGLVAAVLVVVGAGAVLSVARRAPTR